MFFKPENKKLYRIRWPNGEVELVVAENDEDLFMILDEEASPFDAIIEEVSLAEDIRIKPSNQLLSITEIMRLPAKRKLAERDFDKILKNIYGLNEVCLH